MNTATVCLIAKNEERAIAEWLAFQCVIGFDRIVVYDNGSTDSTPDIINRISASEPAVSMVSWPDIPGRRPQPTAYADALAHCSTDWIAFFDTDEFLVLHKHENLREFLSAMPPDASGIAINWLVFGSAGRVEAGDGLVMDRFTRCAKTYGVVKNRICKSIVRPQAVEQMRVHSALLKFGHYVNSMGETIEIEQTARTPAVCHEGAQLNHYLLKSREEFALKKARGHSARALEEKDKRHIQDDEVFWLSHDLNDGEDRLILKWRPAVCAKLASWGMAL